MADKREEVAGRERALTNEAQRGQRIGRRMGDSFISDAQMKPAWISPYEAKVVMRKWLELVHAHNEMRADGWHCSTEMRKDIYAIDRCQAFIDAGIVTQEEFEALRAAVYGDPLHPAEIHDFEVQDRRAENRGPSPF